MDTIAHEPFRSLNDGDVETSGADRRNLRDSLFLAAGLTIADRSHQVRVRNLSSGGMMAEFAEPVAVGTAVQVDLRGIGRVAGRVAWATDGRIGVSLDCPIDPMAARKPVTAFQPAPAKDKPIKPMF